MKENPSFAVQANDYVNQVEDKWVSDQFTLVDRMKKRAKGSKTLIAQHEYESSESALANELERLDPNHERKSTTSE